MAAMIPEPNDFRVRFWGVRGSYPTTGPSTSDIGGDTSCVEISVAGRRLIFDAGTGIIPLGKDDLPARRDPSHQLRVLEPYAH